jgi:hypothetical protein
MKQFALCIHDLRASDAEKIPETIHFVREVFKTRPITIHLIMDRDVSTADAIFRELKKEVDENQLEVVFHGVTHMCPEGTGKLFAWYHKYQAEFMSNSFSTATNRLRYNSLNETIQKRTGICPPCWIAIRDGWKFLRSLSPLYIEKLLSVESSRKRFFSLPVSLASDNRKELYFLKVIASVFTSIAIILRHSRLRLVVHTIDLKTQDSIDFLSGKQSMLISKGFTPVLQKEFIS